jgi:hypothetical protein
MKNGEAHVKGSDGFNFKVVSGHWYYVMRPPLTKFCISIGRMPTMIACYYDVFCVLDFLVELYRQ